MSSVAFDKIVPFGQNFVLDDMPFTLTLKEWVTLCLCLIDSSVDRCEYSKSCFWFLPWMPIHMPLQWMLRNGEDYDLEPESGEENRPSRHSRAHANIRGKSYFKNESDKRRTRIFPWQAPVTAIATLAKGKLRYALPLRGHLHNHV